MKLLILTIALLSSAAYAADPTLELDPTKTECRTLTDGPKFDNDVTATATALFYENQMVYHGYWVTSPVNATAEILRCKSLVAKAVAKKKNLVMNLDRAEDGNSAGASTQGWESDCHWRQEDFLYLEGTVFPGECG